MSKTLKVTISGSFKASDGDIESFDSVVGFIPNLDADKVSQMVVRRYAIIWIGQTRKRGADGKPTDEAKYKRVQKVRQVFVDSVENNDKEPNSVLSYVGKDVMQLNFEELQDFAAANDLAAVPLYKTASLQHARRVAWSEAARKIHGLVGPEYMWTDQQFNPAAHEPIIADDKIRRYGVKPADIEETIDRAQLELSGKGKFTVADPSQSRMTLEQLKAVADARKIKYHATIGWQQLYNKLYKEERVA